MENDSMEYRNLGQSGLKVSVLGFGNMTSGWEGDTEAWSFECIDKCIRAGVNLIDTAEFYGMGKAESVLAKNLKQGGWDRDDLIIQTKLNPAGTGMMGLSTKRMRVGMRKCLERLEMDTADIIFLHRFDHEVPLLEQIRTMNQFIEDEKAYYWGTSEFTPQQLMECHQLCEKYGYIPPIVEQCQYNMLYRDTFEREYAPLYDHYGMGTTIWSPLASGLLSGKYNDGEIPPGARGSHTTFSLLVYFFNLWLVQKRESTIKMLKTLAEISGEVGCTQPQLAIAWAIQNKDVSTCLLGASKPEQLDDTLASVEVMKRLTPEILAKIEDALGNRPSPSMNWRIFTPNPPRR